MSLQLIYAWSKKNHRLVMWFGIVLGIPLALTGVVMENDSLGVWAAGMDWGYKVRELHRELSTKFAFVLAIMMITGFLMWLIPKIVSWKSIKSVKL